MCGRGSFVGHGVKVGKTALVCYPALTSRHRCAARVRTHSHFFFFSPAEQESGRAENTPKAKALPRRLFVDKSCTPDACKCAFLFTFLGSVLYMIGEEMARKRVLVVYHARRRGHQCKPPPPRSALCGEDTGFLTRRSPKLCAFEYVQRARATS